MKVLDATFLIDYGNEADATAEYLLANTGEQFLIPSPVYTEYLLGSVHSSAPTDVEGVQNELAWCEVVETDEDTAVAAARIADEIGPEGPNLTAVDALVAAVARRVNGEVVAGDRDLTHPETQKVVAVDEYHN